MRTLIAALIALVLIGVFLVTMPHCDGLTMSQNCVWIASEHGGAGRSFLDLFGMPIWFN
jgi:hypothetical protein